MPLRRFTPDEVRAGRRRLEPPLFLTVFLASAMFALAEANPVFFVISSVTVLVHVFVAERNMEIYANRTVLNVGVLVVSIVLVVRFLTSSQELLVALGHYVTLIQVCKLFERKRDRDYVQMLVMSLLLVLAAAMMCQELLFAVLALGYLASLTYTVIVLTFKRSLDVEVRQQGAAGEGGRRGWPRRAILLRLSVVLVAVLATGVVVFLITPRGIGGAAPPLRRIRREAASGFSDTVQLGRARSIYLSDRVVMHLRMLSPDGIDLGQSHAPYLRGRIFSEYVDSRWAKPQRTRQYFSVYVPAKVLDGAVRQEVSMSPSLLPVAFATHPAVKVSSPDGSVSRLGDLEYRLQVPPHVDRPIRYTAWVLGGELTEAQRRYVAKLNDYSDPGVGARARVDAPPRVRSLARQWCADLLSERAARPPAGGRGDLDLAIARCLAANLKKNYAYSLDLIEANPDRDGVEDFLFHLRRGHCEYFASALTVMCRTLGVRARLATGFCPREYDEDARHYVVRQRDAHAWTEVYTRGNWLVMDATPAARFEPAATGRWGRWWSGARDAWTRWEFAWFAQVIGYDDNTRRRLAARARGHVLAAWQAVRRAARSVLRGLVELFARGRISESVVWFFASLAAAAMAMAGLLILLRRVRQRRRRTRPPPAPKPPAFLVQLIEVLRRRGVRPQPSQTPREWADHAAEHLHLPPEALGEIIALYYRIRWAGATASRDELAAAEQQVRRLRDMLAH